MNDRGVIRSLVTSLDEMEFTLWRAESVPWKGTRRRPERVGPTESPRTPRFRVYGYLLLYQHGVTIIENLHGEPAFGDEFIGNLHASKATWQAC